MKCWLPTIGIAQPKIFKYASKLTSSGTLIDEYEAILDILPNEADYAAKPSHLMLASRVWLVDYDPYSSSTNLSVSGLKLKEAPEFDPKPITCRLAEHLHKKPAIHSSWTLHNVDPGIIIEDKYSAFDCHTCPPVEFNVFTIWGHVWVAQLNFVEGDGPWCSGFVHQNGTMVAGSHDQPLEDWLAWLDF
jgi:hypothetical protein